MSLNIKTNKIDEALRTLGILDFQLSNFKENAKYYVTKSKDPYFSGIERNIQLSQMALMTEKWQ